MKLQALGRAPMRIAIVMAAALGAAALLAPPAVAADIESVTVGIEPLTTLDPGKGRATRGDLAISSQIYSSLTSVDEDGKLVGDLALEWTQTAPTEWTFKLRDDAFFEDGSPLDADVVAWNLNRMLKGPDAPMPAATGMRLIADVVAKDATTVVFTTSEPFLDLPRRLAWTYFIEPGWAQTHDPATEAMGSGPYTLVSWDPAGDVVLELNEKYYGNKPAVPHATYRVIPNEATRLAALRGGELDAAFGIDPLSVGQLQSEDSLNVGAIDANKMQTMRINMGAPHMDDLRVRQGGNYAINKEAITKSVYAGLVGPGSTQILGPLYDGFEPDRKPWPYDPEKARALLAEAGLSDGITIRLGTAETGYVGAAQATQAIAAQLGQVGINVEIETIPYANWVKYLRDPNGPALTFLAWGSQSVSTPEILAQLVSGAPYAIGPVPAAYDAAVAAATGASDEATKLAEIAKALQVTEDEAMTVFLWPQPQTYAISKKLDWKVRMDDWVRVYDIRPAQ